MEQVNKTLQGRIALVTGGSRGIGKGIAAELGGAGATVYVTARTLTGENGSAEETAAAVTAAGGLGIPVQCDHKDDGQVAAVFAKIQSEQGRLDILVNNVFSAPDLVAGPDLPGGIPFWEAPLSAWDTPNNVGLRSHYVATVMAMPLLLESHGLIVNISSGGAYIYFDSIPYGAGKAALDRMTSDMAHEIGDRPVSIVSLWPGMVGTEHALSVVEKNPALVAAYLRMASTRAREMAARMSTRMEGTTIETASEYEPTEEDGSTAWELVETVYFTGRAVVALAGDPKVQTKTGRAFSVVGLADEYGFTDVDGRKPDPFHFRDVAAWVPLQDSRGK